MKLDHDRFIKPAFHQGDDEKTKLGWHMSSLLLRVDPKAFDDVSSQIEVIKGAEIAMKEDGNKIIVLLETPTEAEIVSALNEIETLPGVWSAGIVFHHHEGMNMDK